MLRIVYCSVLLLFLILSNGLSLADTFKCTQPDGSVFFTNDPSQVPGGCVIERVTGLPPIGIIPDTPLKESPVPGVERSIPPKTPIGESKSFESFRSEAELLVERFKSAQRSYFHSTLVADKLVSRRELTGIREKQTVLANEIAQSPLSRAEKQNLQELLSPITE